MSKFLETEKPQQTNFKLGSQYFSEPARHDGEYKGIPRPFCLPVGHAEENLFPDVRRTASDFFSSHGIKWHDGHDGKPSNHLCDSQLCCINFLYPFADKPDALATLLRPFFTDLHQMLPVEDGHYVSFEWIGAQNYLNEKIRSGAHRTRGANFTSADAIVMFERLDGRRQSVLIEWKYTESYGGNSLKISVNGTDRTKIYQPLFDRDDCPLDKSRLPSFEALFYEPFYQLMRQQFLAHEMEKARELGADIVTLLHLAPSHNQDFRKITSPALRNLGSHPTEIWKRIIRTPDRFTSLDTESLFAPLLANPPKDMKSWADYIKQRYLWVLERK